MQLPGDIDNTKGKKSTAGDELVPIECFRCGICCQRHQAGVSSREIGAIAGNMGLAKADFILKYVVKAPIKEGYLLQKSDKGCIFLKFAGGINSASCIIHSVRPSACREWAASLSRSECRQGMDRIK